MSPNELRDRLLELATIILDAADEAVDLAETHNARQTGDSLYAISHNAEECVRVGNRLRRLAKRMTPDL